MNSDKLGQAIAQMSVRKALHKLLRMEIEMTPRSPVALKALHACAYTLICELEDMGLVEDTTMVFDQKSGRDRMEQNGDRLRAMFKDSMVHNAQNEDES